MKTFILAFSLYLSVSYAKIPDWAANNNLQLNGPVVTAVCSGTGPSIDIARKDAIHSCQITASQFLKTKINVKSLSIQTENSSGFHEEVTQNYSIEGLTCLPQKDEAFEENGAFRIWIKCNFDLSQTIVEADSKTIDYKDQSKTNTLEVIQINKKENYLSKFILISVVPKCDSMIIKGTQSRIIDCRNNPMKIQIAGSETEILIRAKNYKPKSIQIGELNENRTYQVLLDLL